MLRVYSVAGNGQNKNLQKHKMWYFVVFLTQDEVFLTKFW